jgi:alpha-beta hydrolase superfamily lysophospholipase
VDIEGSREVFAAAPKGLATLITYPDAYHEIFNDPARDQAVSDLVKWLGQVLPR